MILQPLQTFPPLHTKTPNVREFFFFFFKQILNSAFTTHRHRLIKEEMQKLNISISERSHLYRRAKDFFFFLEGLERSPSFSLPPHCLDLNVKTNTANQLNPSGSNDSAPETNAQRHYLMWPRPTTMGPLWETWSDAPARRLLLQQPEVNKLAGPPGAQASTPPRRR